MEIGTQEQKKEQAGTGWNKWGYGVFTLAGILFTFFGSDASQGPMFMALALIFDPFDQSQQWNERPRWQRAWLIAHLGLSAAALGYVIAQ
jgi:hypothetical protein